MKKLTKDITSFGKTTAGLGLSTMVTASITSKYSGGSTSGLTEGLNTVSGFMPIVGTAMMGKHTLKMTKKLK